MVKPLTFKGDKKSKKRKRKEDHDEETSQSLTRQNDQSNIVDDDDTWVTADIPSDITGPIIIILPSEQPTCLACDVNGKVFASPLENIVENDLGTAEPHDVRQVWVANRVAGTEGLSFKGHHGRYLSCDKFGHLSALREAIGAEESFRCISPPDTPGMFSIQTERETYLGISSDSNSNSNSNSSTTVEIRGDSTEIEYTTTLRIRMQARFKPKLKANKEEKARGKISRKELEEVVGRRLEEDEIRRLKKARREGNYHEAILDVRVKGKHDKFAS
ncbi:MAG: hypothetical protein M1823_002591 [Watsoniomyces obsoletus]|nr:MAG: hypothetical protein M1823_002591 [Watsoniomyces obsoletus]